MGRSTPTTAFDGAIWYFAYTMLTHWTYAWRSLVQKKKMTKRQQWELRQYSLIRCLYLHRLCLYGPINSYHNFWCSNLILCLYNVSLALIPMPYIRCMHFGRHGTPIFSILGYIDYFSIILSIINRVRLYHPSNNRFWFAFRRWKIWYQEYALWTSRDRLSFGV